MQLIMVLGIVIAIAAVMFSLQNNAPVVVTLAAWTFEGSLALVLLISLGLGALIAGLLSSPAVIGGRWSAGRLRKRVAELERQLEEERQRARDLEDDATRLSSADVRVVPEKPYVGLRALISQSEQAPDAPESSESDRH